MSDAAQSDGPKRLAEFSPVIHTPITASVVHVGTIPKKQFCPFCGFRLEPESRPPEVGHEPTHVHVVIPAADGSLEGRASAYAKRVAEGLWGIPTRTLESKHKAAPVARARSAIMWALRMCGFQLVTIGNQFGGRDHSTVLHALHATNQRREQEPQFDAECQQLYARTKAYLSGDSTQRDAADSTHNGAASVPDSGSEGRPAAGT